MPKTIHTPRDELICGVLDELANRCRADLGALTLIERARTMAERMETKLFERKQAADSHRCPSSFDLWVAEQEAAHEAEIEEAQRNAQARRDDFLGYYA